MHAPEAGAAPELEHRLGVQVPAADGGRRTDDLVQEGLRRRVALERRALAALLVVEDEAEREPRAARPLRIRRRRPVADEVAISSSALPACDRLDLDEHSRRQARAHARARGYGSSKNSRYTSL